MTKQNIKQVVIESLDAQTIFAEFEKLRQIIVETKQESLLEREREKFLTRKEVAELYKITLPTLHEWTNKGILKSYRIGNKIRYKETEVMVATTPVLKGKAHNKSSY